MSVSETGLSADTPGQMTCAWCRQQIAPGEETGTVDVGVVHHPRCPIDEHHERSDSIATKLYELLPGHGIVEYSDAADALLEWLAEEWERQAATITQLRAALEQMIDAADIVRDEFTFLRLDDGGRDVVITGSAIEKVALAHLIDTTDVAIGVWRGA